MTSKLGKGRYINGQSKEIILNVNSYFTEERIKSQAIVKKIENLRKDYNELFLTLLRNIDSPHIHPSYVVTNIKKLKDISEDITDTCGKFKITKVNELTAKATGVSSNMVQALTNADKREGRASAISSPKRSKTRRTKGDFDEIDRLIIKLEK